MADLQEIGYRITETGTDTTRQKLAALEQQANRTAGVGGTSGGFGGLGQAITDAARAAQRVDQFERIGAAIGTELRGQIDAATASLGGFGNVLASIGPIGLAAAAAIGLITFSFIEGLRDADKYQQAVLGLESSLRAAGNATGFTKDKLAEFASAMEDATLFTEEQILKTEAIINQYGIVTGEQFKEVTKLALDMAQTMGTEPVDAARALMRALQDPEQGLGQLRRSFSVLSPAVVDAVKNLVDAGEKAKAMQLIIDTLASKVGGTAEHASQGSLAGAWSNATDAMGDFVREMANATGATDATTNVLDALSAQLQRTTQHMHDGAQAWRDWWDGANPKGMANLRSFGDTIGGLVSRFEAWRIALNHSVTEQARGVEFQQKFIDNLKAEAGLGARSANERAVSLAGETAVQKALTEAKAHDIDVSKLNLDVIRKTAEEFKRQEIAQTQSWHAATKGAQEAAREAKRAQDEFVRVLEEGARGAEHADANLKKFVDRLKEQEATAGLSNEEAEKANALFQAQAALVDKLGGSYRQLSEAEKQAIVASVEHRQALEEEKKRTDELAQGIGDDFGSLATDLEQGGEAGKQALVKFLQQIVELIFKLYVLIPLVKELKSAMGGLDLFGGGDAGGSFTSDAALFSSIGFARGGAFDAGRIIRARKGMVTTSRQIAPLVEFGEAGPEAIMPLQRMADGRLGVSMNGGGDGGGGVVVQNIDQRSKGQPVQTETQQGPNGQTIIRNFIRDEVKRGVAAGDFDKEFKKNFDVQRHPVRR
jgi:hypothetical protein